MKPSKCKCDVCEDRNECEVFLQDKQKLVNEKELVLDMEPTEKTDAVPLEDDRDIEVCTEMCCFGREDNRNRLLPCDVILAQDMDFKYEVKDAPEQGTDKWLAWRKQGITATEAAGIMFPDTHSSPMTVYGLKLGLIESDQSDTDGYMEWGHLIEDLLVNKFMKINPKFTKCTQGRLYQNGWAKCSLDAQCFDEEGRPCIIECKTGQDEGKWNPIPDRYYAQVQWQMYVTGIRKAYFSVLIRGHIYFTRSVDFNPAFVKQMIAKCQTVWECIQTKTPPASLGFFSVDKEVINAMAGEAGHSEPPDEVDEETVTKYAVLKEAYEKAEAEFMAFKNSLGFRMVNVSKLLFKGRTFATWVERKGAVTVDKVKLQTQFPEVYEKCLKQGAGTRYVKYSV